MSQARCTVDTHPDMDPTFDATNYDPGDFPEIVTPDDNDERAELYFYGHGRLRVGDVIERGDMTRYDYLLVLDFEDGDIVVRDLDDQEEFSMSRRTLKGFSQEGYCLKIIEDPFNIEDSISA